MSSFTELIGNADIWKAIGAALAGGGLIKYVESWLNKSKYKSEADKADRDERRAEAEGLRNQITSLKKELQVTEEEIDVWKVKYWKIYTEYQQFKLTIYRILIQNGIDPEEVMPKDHEDLN